MKKLISYLSLIIFFFGLLVTAYVQFGFFWEYEEAEASINDYLEEKYKDEFALEDIRFDWRNGGSYYTNAAASATGSEFYVEVSCDKNFFDAYTFEYWSSEGVRLVKPFVSENIPDYDGIAVDLHFEENVQDANLLVENLDSISWEVFVNATYELDSNNEADELDKAFNLLEELESNSFKLKKVEILYIGKSLVLTGDDFAGINDPSEMKEYLKNNE